MFTRTGWLPSREHLGFSPSRMSVQRLTSRRRPAHRLTPGRHCRAISWGVPSFPEQRDGTSGCPPSRHGPGITRCAPRGREPLDVKTPPRRSTPRSSRATPARSSIPLSPGRRASSTRWRGSCASSPSSPAPTPSSRRPLRSTLLASSAHPDRWNSSRTFASCDGSSTTVRPTGPRLPRPARCPRSPFRDPRRSEGQVGGGPRQGRGEDTGRRHGSAHHRDQDQRIP